MALQADFEINNIPAKALYGVVESASLKRFGREDELELVIVLDWYTSSVKDKFVTTTTVKTVFGADAPMPGAPTFLAYLYTQVKFIDALAQVPLGYQDV